MSWKEGLEDLGRRWDAPSRALFTVQVWKIPDWWPTKTTMASSRGSRENRRVASLAAAVNA